MITVIGVSAVPGVNFYKDNIMYEIRFIFRLLISLFLLFIIVVPDVLAHSGRTDSYGCHTCRTNCSSWGLSYGEYHCHQAKSLPQPEEPIHSKYGEGGTGYTNPAPEYKKTNSNIIPINNINLNSNANSSSLNDNYNVNTFDDTNNFDVVDGFVSFITIALVVGGVYLGYKMIKK